MFEMILTGVVLVALSIAGFFIYCCVSCTQDEKRKQQWGKQYLIDCIQEINQRFHGNIRCPATCENADCTDLYGTRGDAFTSSGPNICTLYFNTTADHSGPLAFLAVQRYAQGIFRQVDCYKRGASGSFDYCFTYSREECLDLLIWHDYVFERDKYVNLRYEDRDDLRSCESFLRCAPIPDFICRSHMSREFLAPLERNGDL